MDDGPAGKVHSKIKFIWQPGGNGFEMSARKRYYHYFIRNASIGVLITKQREKPLADRQFHSSGARGSALVRWLSIEEVATACGIWRWSIDFLY
jgi:hypothetical protein